MYGLLGAEYKVIAILSEGYKIVFGRRAFEKNKCALLIEAELLSTV
jgi:hypothetical protein